VRAHSANLEELATETGTETIGVRLLDLTGSVPGVRG
jgi:hypothetical protein